MLLTTIVYNEWAYIYAFSMFKFSKSWLKGLSDDHWKMRDPHRLGLTRTSVGATLSRHTSGSDQEKTLELPVSVDIKFYSRIWKAACTLPFWLAMFFYITSGTDQNTCLPVLNRILTFGYLQVLVKTHFRLNWIFTSSGPEVHYSRLWMKYECSFLLLTSFGSE